MRAAEVGQAFIDARPRRMMTDQEQHALFLLTRYDVIREKERNEVDYQPNDEDKTLFFKVIEARLAFGPTPVYNSVIALAAICSDRVAIAVMYAAAIRAIYEKLNRKVSLLDFCNAFGDGFPDEQAAFKVWEGQKIRDGVLPDNWVDRDTWKFPAEAEQPPA